jgi:hypothetical protein
MGHGIDSDEDFQARMDADTLKQAVEIKADSKRLAAAEANAEEQIKALKAITRDSSLVTGERKKITLIV